MSQFGVVLVVLVDVVVGPGVVVGGGGAHGSGGGGAVVGGGGAVVVVGGGGGGAHGTVIVPAQTVQGIVGGVQLHGMLPRQPCHVWCQLPSPSHVYWHRPIQNGDGGGGGGGGGMQGVCALEQFPTQVSLGNGQPPHAGSCEHWLLTRIQP